MASRESGPPNWKRTTPSFKTAPREKFTLRSDAHEMDPCHTTAAACPARTGSRAGGVQQHPGLLALRLRLRAEREGCRGASQSLRDGGRKGRVPWAAA